MRRRRTEDRLTSESPSIRCFRSRLVDMLERRASQATGVLQALSSSSEPEIKTRAAGSLVAHSYAGAMCPDDLHNDRQPQTGTFGTSSLTAPEALEDVRPILSRDARTAVRDADRALRVDLDDHFGSLRRMRERVFNKVSQRIGNCHTISGDDDGVLGAGERDRPAVQQRQMCHRADYLFGKLPQIDRCRDIQRYRVETGNTEQLLDQPVHPPDLVPERRNLTVALESVEAGSDDGQRRSQFMRGIGGEPACSNRSSA